MAHQPIRLGSLNSASLFQGGCVCLCARRSRQTIWCRVLRSPDRAAAAATAHTYTLYTHRCPSFPPSLPKCLPYPTVYSPPALRAPRMGFTLIRGFVEFPGSLWRDPDPIARLPYKWHEFTRAVALPVSLAMDRFFLIRWY